MSKERYRYDTGCIIDTQKRETLSDIQVKNRLNKHFGEIEKLKKENEQLRQRNDQLSRKIEYLHKVIRGDELIV